MPPDNQQNEPSGASMDLASFERLVRVETKLDAVIDSKITDHSEMAKDISDHEERLRALERIWWKSAGVAAGVAALVASAASAAIGAVLR